MQVCGRLELRGLEPSTLMPLGDCDRNLVLGFSQGNQQEALLPTGEQAFHLSCLGNVEERTQIFFLCRRFHIGSKAQFSLEVKLQVFICGLTSLLFLILSHAGVGCEAGSDEGGSHGIPSQGPCRGPG